MAVVMKPSPSGGALLGDPEIPDDTTAAVNVAAGLIAEGQG
jgi:hypothetical protein